MTDHVELVAVCRKKLSSAARHALAGFAQAALMSDDDEDMLLGNAIHFLFEREKQIDVALAAPTVFPTASAAQLS